ncbi:hypothetical protein ACROYT_G030020 [Oculina patagonica]
MFEKFVIQRPVKFLPAEEFSVFMFGRGSFEDFELKGYDIIAKALASLGRKYELTFVGSPHGEQKKLQKWFLDETKIAKNQLNIRGYCDYEKMKKMLRQADVIVMPSRTEGFGLVALEAISAGVPVLVSSECGIAKALKDVKGGKSVVVNSDKPEEWARRIHDLSELKAEERNAHAIHLREQYGKIYNWQKECERFKEMIHELVQRQRKAVPLNVSLTDQDGGMTVKVEAVISLDGNEAQMNNNTVPLTGQDGKSIYPTSSTATGAKGKSSTDQKRNTAPPMTSKTRFKKTNKVGVLATDRLTSVEGKLDGVLQKVQHLETALSGVQSEINALQTKTTKIKEATDRVMDAGLTNLNTKVQELRRKINDNQKEIKAANDRCLYQEVYNRRENLRLLGVPESSDTENTSEVVYRFIEMELEIDNARDIEFQRVHRIGKKKVRAHRPIIVRFLRFPDRERVFKKALELKEDTEVRVYTDLPKEIQERRKKQWPKLKKAREEGKVASFDRKEPDKLLLMDSLFQCNETFRK